jgi:hypothetical protein
MMTAKTLLDGPWNRLHNAGLRASVFSKPISIAVN